MSTRLLGAIGRRNLHLALDTEEKKNKPENIKVREE
jgi:hypothetical protein